MPDSPTIQALLQPPNTLDDLDIPQNIIIDIVLRLLFNEGNVNFRRFSQVIRVPHVVDKVLDWMKKEHLVEVLPGSSGIGRLGYVYTLSTAGEDRARTAMERSQYVGPAPVPILQYIQAIELQTQNKLDISAAAVEKSLGELILPTDFHRRIGPAVNSGSSLFLYGPSGNGKTTIARAIAGLIAQTEPIWLPYALTAGGHVIQVFDRLVHKEAPTEAKPFSEVDGRWGLFQRPIVAAGGEMKMESLELRFDPITKIYEAPLQIKANGGMFLIDDFGRQQVSPTKLLNRWIVPLEEAVDYLRLNNGQTIVIPFRQLIIFSTNLDPYELADDAFYRRIQMKISIDSPDLERYRQIFLAVCAETGMPFEQSAFDFLIQKWYQGQNRDYQAVHPRDLLRIVQALCDYEGQPAHLTADLVDEACRSYFVETN
ncbi:MAG: ATP-binding protein [Anaerolineales bacterium]|nr:ATP-binding protein [Anaerolineales bacterium]